jgi:hypothetical protein
LYRGMCASRNMPTGKQKLMEKPGEGATWLAPGEEG